MNTGGRLPPLRRFVDNEGPWYFSGLSFVKLTDALFAGWLNVRFVLFARLACVVGREPAGLACHDEVFPVKSLLECYFSFVDEDIFTVPLPYDIITVRRHANWRNSLH